MLTASLRNTMRRPAIWMQAIIKSIDEGKCHIEDIDYVLAGGRLDDGVLEVYVSYIQVVCSRTTYYIELESSNVISICSNKPENHEYIFDKRHNTYKNFKEMDDKLSQLLIDYIVELLEIDTKETSIGFWVDTQLPENKDVDLSPCDVLIIKDHYDAK